MIASTLISRIILEAKVEGVILDVPVVSNRKSWRIGGLCHSSCNYFRRCSNASNIHHYTRSYGQHFNIVAGELSSEDSSGIQTTSGKDHAFSNPSNGRR